MTTTTTATSADFPVPEPTASHAAWHRLEDQRQYYSRCANHYQATYKRIKLTLIGLSATIPLLAFLPGDGFRYVVAAAGVLIALLEGVLLLNQYGSLWVKYRGTAESLKRERWLLLAHAGEYKGLGDEEALRLLAERVEVLLDVEHREWTEEQKQALMQLSKTREWVQAQQDEMTQAVRQVPAQ
ncbi:MAG TPA: DUF4231 domain-containing protein [Burkholderiaceae bacterium]|nr:DUF4231 domain-containing protein [Burkholderiaceae bacterium]